MQPKPAPLSPAEYFEWDEKSPVKYEYVDGETYAQSGAKRAHNLIAGNLFARAWLAAKAKPGCQVFGSDMKVHVETHNCFYYPDVSASCDPADLNERFVVRPCFIVEVSSSSTVAIDRREESGWRGYILTEPDDVLESSCLGLRLELRDVYDGVALPAPGVAEPQMTEYAI